MTLQQFINDLLSLYLAFKLVLIRSVDALRHTLAFGHFQMNMLLIEGIIDDVPYLIYFIIVC